MLFSLDSWFIFCFYVSLEIRLYSRGLNKHFTHFQLLSAFLMRSFFIFQQTSLLSELDIQMKTHFLTFNIIAFNLHDCLALFNPYTLKYAYIQEQRKYAQHLRNRTINGGFKKEIKTAELILFNL